MGCSHKRGGGEIVAIYKVESLDTKVARRIFDGVARRYKRPLFLHFGKHPNGYILLCVWPFQVYAKETTRLRGAHCESKRFYYSILLSHTLKNEEILKIEAECRKRFRKTSKYEPDTIPMTAYEARIETSIYYKGDSLMGRTNAKPDFIQFEIRTVGLDDELGNERLPVDAIFAAEQIAKCVWSNESQQVERVLSDIKAALRARGINVARVPEDL